MNVRLPNFLIVGAAKAGSTSLYNYLKQHPDVYMSPVKEPNFLIADCFRKPHSGPNAKEYDSCVIKDLDQYKELFVDVRNEKSLGEASVAYLYHYEQAIPNIKSMLGQPKIVIILRDPVYRAFSTYMHQVRDGVEPLSFEDALRDEDKRIKENWLPFWYHTKFGLYYNQVKAYLANFSEVKIYLFKDLKENASELMKDCYEFLNVDSSFVPNNLGVRYNITGRAKYKLVHNLLTKPNPVKSMVKMCLRVLIGEEQKVAAGQKIRGLLFKKPPMKQETRKYLIEVFREDILALQDLINRDLSHWLI